MKRIISVAVTIFCFVFFKALVAKYLHAEPIDANFRATFIKASIESCLSAQTKAPENKDLTMGQLTNYCSCMATAEVNNFGEADYKLIAKSNQVVPPEIQKRIDVMAPACIADIVKEMQNK